MFVGSAFANFGPHGGYVNDTDSCAGCHRAHTSFSTVGWTDIQSQPHASALLVGDAQTMTEFCNACHGDLAPGASTNVASGIFDSGPSAAALTSTGGSQGPATGALGTTVGAVDNTSVVTTYRTASVFNAPLNGGGFNRMPDPYAWQNPGGATIAYKASTSAHKMDVSGPLWGAGNAMSDSGSSLSNMTCTDCHDPHGTANYRLLKAQPNPGGPVVGGYQADGVTPNPFVFGNEQGYPIPNSLADNPSGGIVYGAAPDGGWLKHQDGADQMAVYRPNYTDTTGTPILHTSTVANTKSLSVWCSACHQQYNQPNANVGVNYSYNNYLPGMGGAAQVGATSYHRHAVDQNMLAGTAGITQTLTEQVVSDNKWVPLETAANIVPTKWQDDYIGCLTCHRAHGSSVEMTGFAAAHLSVNAEGTYAPVRDNIPGVDPDKGSYNGANNQGTSSLLRADNRGVCERCHNK